MELLSYKCPCCASPLTYNSESGEMHCKSCDNSYSPETLRKYDEAIKDNSDYSWSEYEKQGFDEGESENIKTYICESCGGEIITDATTSATRCPYCDNVQIISGQLLGKFKPDLVIPFKFAREDAENEYKKFCENKKLLPNFFKSRSRIESITGVYVPFWVFYGRAQADVNYRGTKVTVWRRGDYRFTKTSHYSIIRKGDLDFKHIPVDGSQRIENRFMEAIEPFDLSTAKDFATAYLAGYLAEKYDVEAEECKPRANERIKNTTEELFRESVGGYDTVTTEHSNVRIQDGEVKYVLLPVWLLNTKYEDKIYTFAMNGQTGKFVGELPVDKRKAWLCFGSVAAIAEVILLLVAFLFFM